MDFNKIETRVRRNIKGCWIWLGAVSSSGYGQLEENGKTWTAHAYTYQCFHPKPPKSKEIRHTCNNKLCCNPKHLVLGTAKENYADSKEQHEKADAERRYKPGWTIDGKTYDTAKEAVEKTGISMNSVIKYTHGGKFDRKKYEDACKKAGTYPVKPRK